MPCYIFNYVIIIKYIYIYIYMNILCDLFGCVGKKIEREIYQKILFESIQSQDLEL